MLSTCKGHAVFRHTKHDPNKVNNYSTRPEINFNRILLTIIIIKIIIIITSMIIFKTKQFSMMMKITIKNKLIVDCIPEIFLLEQIQHLITFHYPQISTIDFNIIFKRQTRHIDQQFT